MIPGNGASVKNIAPAQLFEIVSMALRQFPPIPQREMLPRQIILNVLTFAIPSVIIVAEHIFYQAFRRTAWPPLDHLTLSARPPPEKRSGVSDPKTSKTAYF
jgi:hypothetical protein